MKAKYQFTSRKYITPALLAGGTTRSGHRLPTFWGAGAVTFSQPPGTRLARARAIDRAV
jgi:hypothetical protein